MRSGSTILLAAGPLMRAAAQERRINVGLAAADREDMVYLESIRYNQRASLRTVVSGQRIPMDLTALGRAHLSTLSKEEFVRMMARFEKRERGQWDRVHAEIRDAVDSVHAHGYCGASWQPEVVAIAAPLAIPGHRTVVVNFSVRSVESMQAIVAELSKPLLELRDQILAEVARIES
jgi:DNA-binding IclR family transcriptional regulator